MPIQHTERRELRAADLVALVRAALRGEALPEPAAAGDIDAAAAEVEALGLAGLVASEAHPDDGAGGAALRARLGERTVATAFATTLRLETAERALAALEAAGVEALLLKGAALHRAGVYREPRARPMDDVDLLVRPARAGEAVAALVSAGFEPWEPWTGAHPEWVSAFTLEDGGAPAGVSCPLDLHWATDYTRLRHGPGWAGETLWEGARPPSPSPEGHFVLTVEHLLKHLRVTVHLTAVADLVRLLPTLPRPEEVARHARVRGSLPGVRAVVGALDDLGAPLPPALLASVGGRGRAARAARAGGVRLPELVARARGRSRRLGDWAVLRGAVGTAAEVARVLLPPAAWLEARYPERAGRLRRRVRYLRDLAAWVASRGASPLSPNQGLR